MGAAAPPLHTLTADWHASSHRRRLAALLTATVLTSAGFAGLVVLLQFVSMAVIATVLLLVLMAWKPRLGVYTLWAVALLFEGDSRDPLMLVGVYLNGDISAFFHLPGVIFSPVELMLVLGLVIWLAQGAMRRDLEFRSGTLWLPMVLFLAALFFGLAWGAATGGLFNFALWESRFLFYMIVMYVLTANTIRTRRHVQDLLTIFFVATTLFGIEGAYRRIALIDTGQLGELSESWYSHEDVIFLGSFLLLFIIQNVFGAPRWQRLLGPVFAAIVGYTLLASERRAGYIAVMIGFATLTLIFLGVNRRAFFRISVPLILCSLVYLPVFWTATGPLAQPARAVRSLSDPDPRDASSNLSRELEKTNIIATIKSAPITGVGFGRPYLIVVPIPDISWFVFWQYETHRNILWMWLKTGAAGFICFFFFMGSGLLRAANLSRTLRARETRTFAILAVCGIVVSLVYCYVDLGLTAGRVDIFLGTLLGGVSVLHRINA